MALFRTTTTACTCRCRATYSSVVIGGQKPLRVPHNKPSRHLEGKARHRGRGTVRVHVFADDMEREFLNLLKFKCFDMLADGVRTIEKVVVAPVIEDAVPIEWLWVIQNFMPTKEMKKPKN